jgi:hypothetical protein
MTLKQFEEVESRMRKMGYPKQTAPSPTNVDIFRSIDKQTVRPDFAIVGGDVERSDTVKAFDKLQKIAQKGDK